MVKNKREPVHKSYEMASGPIAYNMTNDYMFRAILQYEISGRSTLLLRP
ncbi:MAG: hypothetical protein MSA09_12805 [Lachnospiraceae bacterium]|nr:hypothetical protein [Lachnospiraceae bacterium]